MKNENYYVYSNGILGVKSNIKDFKWIYGSVAPYVSREDYQRCEVKFEINLKPERELPAVVDYDKKFQSYYWQERAKTLSCRRTLFGKISIGYDITVNDGSVTVEMGSNYYKLVKKRVMNLHGVYYLLSDLANIMLLNKGYVTLYASALHNSAKKRGIVCFAPPGIGKTVTATKLCEIDEYSLVGEDVVLFKDGVIFACPYTASYRGRKTFLDSSGALGRTKKASIDKVSHFANVTDIFLLVNGNPKGIEDKETVLSQIALLNGYLFSYSSSPIVKILGYFDPEFLKNWDSYAVEKIKKLVDECEFSTLYSRDPLKFSELIHNKITGEIK